MGIEMSDYLLIIDGSSLLTTQFFGNLPREIIFAKTMEEKAVYFPKIMQTSGGVYTNAVYGFLRVLLKILKEQRPAYLAVAWDVSRNTFRRELYPDYKGNRGETMQPLKEQFTLCQQVLKKMRVPQFMDPRYEADDFSGTLTSMFEDKVPVRIMTKDHDYLQLVSGRTQLWMIHSTAKKTEELYEKYHMRQKDYNVPDRTFPFDPEMVEKEFGVKPESVNSLKGLQGDTSDNIKGVPGIGAMTAAALIHEYGSVERLYEVIHQADEAGRKKLAEYWKNTLGIKRSPMGALLKESETELTGEKAARLSKKLATIKRDIPLEIALEDLKVDIDRQAAEEEFGRLEFRSLKIEDAKPEEDGFIPAGENPFDGSMPVQDNPFADMPAGNPFAPAGGNNPFVNEAGEDPFEAMFAGDNPFENAAGKADSVNAAQSGPAREQKNDTEFPEYAEPQEIREVSVISELSNVSALFRGKILAFQILAEQKEGIMAVLQNENGIQYYGAPGSRGSLEELFLKAAAEGMLLVTNGLKEQLGYLQEERMYEFCRKEQLVDTEIAAYLLDPLPAAYGYADLAKRYYGVSLPEEKELLKKLSPKEAAMFEPASVKKLLSLNCNMSFLTAGALLNRLKEKQMERLYFELEMPLVFTLFAMQQRGIRVQKEELEQYGVRLGAMIEKLEAEIYELAGERFNINSPKQLGVILFEKLSLPGGKKTKSGYSTAADVLEKLADEHPVVEKILEYRQYTKLKSTYTDGLAGYIAEDGRIHGTFHQTMTATGRISSTDPNLQNIPVRMELGRQLRKVFVPEEGYVFLDADYSQIELRVLAHMSGDKRLIAAYNEEQDIHRITASQVFHTPFEEVTKEQRSRAKAVNFGIVYGISSFGLGQGLNISRHEAEDYMAKYFETYPGVKQFMEQLVARGRETKETRTLLGRIRPLPDISAANHRKRAAEERVAMNAPIQGTAADIMKIAMIRVDRRLVEGGFASRLLLQIHDELLVETAVNEAEEVKRIIVEEMRNAMQLLVPLEVSASEGNNWLEAH